MAVKIPRTDGRRHESNELLLGNQHDAQAKIIDLEIRIAAEAIRNTAVLGTAEPTATADDVQLAFRAERIHDAVTVSIRQDFVLPFAGVETPFPNIARHVIQTELVCELHADWLRADVRVLRMPCDIVDDITAAVREMLSAFSAASGELPLRFGG